MCVICGQVFCPTNCPAYDLQYDPWVSGLCEACGAALYEDGATVCERCRKQRTDDGEETKKV